MRYNLLIFLAILFSCCRDENTTIKFAKDNLIFAGYFNRNFHTAIPFDSTNFILISESGCPGCMIGLINKLQKNKKSKIIVSDVLYQKLINGYNFKITSNYLIDSSGEINQLKYHRGNIGIIQTCDKNIYDILQPSIEKIDSFSNLLAE